MPRSTSGPVYSDSKPVRASVLLHADGDSAWMVLTYVRCPLRALLVLLFDNADASSLSDADFPSIRAILLILLFERSSLLLVLRRQTLILAMPLLHSTLPCPLRMWLAPLSAFRSSCSLRYFFCLIRSTRTCCVLNVRFPCALMSPMFPSAIA
jgi:hypothetical protein